MYNESSWEGIQVKIWSFIYTLYNVDTMACHIRSRTEVFICDVLPVLKKF